MDGSPSFWKEQNASLVCLNIRISQVAFSVSVPLTIKDPSGTQDTATLVAGMLGFTVHRTDTTDEVTVQPFQGWSLMLGDDSPFVLKHD